MEGRKERGGFSLPLSFPSPSLAFPLRHLWKGGGRILPLSSPLGRLPWGARQPLVGWGAPLLWPNRPNTLPVVTGTPSGTSMTIWFSP